MVRLKALGSKAAVSAHGPQASVSAGQPKHRKANPTDLTTQSNLLSVYDGTRHLGFLLLRGPRGVEAFNVDCISLGTYRNQRAAADAVTLAAGGTA